MEPTSPTATKPIAIDVWSDIVCPWCYLGKWRLDRALANVEGSYSVRRRAFQLRPETPRFGEDGAGGPKNDHLIALGHDPARLAASQARVTQLIAAEGPELHLGRSRNVNTRAAHTLLAEATDPALAEALLERLFHAQMTAGLRIDDPEVLEAIAAEAGLTAAARRPRPIAEAAVDDDLATAAKLGIGSVPFFVFDRRLALTGAQEVEALEETLRRAAE